MSDTNTYRIRKVLNNNVILAADIKTNQESILIGKGIGFSQKANKIVKLKSADIEKSFVAYDDKTKDEYYKLINQLDAEVMGVSEEIIAIAEKKFGKLNSHIHIALTDHIGFAIDRIKMGMEVNNPFLNEIKYLYTEEYKIGDIASSMIQNKINVKIPDSEVGFIALHIHAARQNKEVKETVKYTSLIRDLIKIVEDELQIKLDRTELSYIRLVNHLRFAIDRVKKGTTIKNPIVEKIVDEFNDSYELAQKIGNQIRKRLSCNVCKDELSYITIHIQRLKNTYNN